jgi:excisionase family DNA binding protein
MVAPRYLTSEQAARYLGFGEGERGANLIRQMVHKRQIEHIKLGTRLRFDIRTLDAWMATKRVKAEDGNGVNKPPKR